MGAADQRVYKARPAEFYRLWLVAAATYGVGDTVTSISFIFYDVPIQEANPVIAAGVSEFGLWGLVLVKLLAFLVAILLSARLADPDVPRLVFYYPPALFAIVGAYLTVHNLLLLYRVPS